MLVNYNGKDIKLPNFLIVGAAKSGTTSLHYYLKQHPDVFTPSVWMGDSLFDNKGDFPN